ncbi:sigma 54-interacting transcriptional regulator [Sporomusa aerivorans]|uniref:sigma 54-interacting transcriptional regulator n=1 Tax=Sporomusa aerivorans TaxID=204936 RepID=UPI00352B57C3
MSKIAYIAPDKYLFLKGKKIIQELGLTDTVDIYLTKSNNIAELIRELQNKDIDVLVTRGGTANLLIESKIRIPVLEIAITAQDLAKVYKKAKHITGLPNPRITAIGFNNTIKAVAMFAEILDIRLTAQLLEKTGDISRKIHELSPDSTDIVIGGANTVIQARKKGLKAVYIHTGSFAFQSAFLEAKRIALARQLEKEKAQEFKALVDYSLEGIIYINREKVITIFNHAAEKLLDCSAQKVLGAQIDSVLQIQNLNTCLFDGKEIFGQIVKIGDRWITSNLGPIQVGQSIIGIVITFQDVTRIQETEAKIRNEVFAKQFIAKYHLEDILGESDKICESKRIAQEIAPLDATVLIVGETGTGKELFAQSIHNMSRRRNGPFVAVNCAALPANLLESELFGYVEGAFTGATRKGKPGLFEMAHRGTIFLDEITEMDKYGQTRLLRVLQEKQVMRLGDDKYIPIDVRIIAATNQNLKEAVRNGHFRQDLLYRLKVLTINLPPLRIRQGDIHHLARHFMDYYLQRHHKQIEFPAKAYDALTAYDWPGNVRELKFFMERLVATARNSSVITEQVIYNYLEDREYEPAVPSSIDKETAVMQEKILASLKQTNFNITKAAKILGIDRSTLHRWLKIYNIEVKKTY